MKKRLLDYLENKPLAVWAGIGILAGAGVMTLGFGLLAAAPLLVLPAAVGIATLAGAITGFFGAALVISASAIGIETGIRNFMNKMKEPPASERASPATGSPLKKTITVQYTEDGGAFTACALSPHFNLSAVVTQAPDFERLKDRAQAAIDLVLEDQGRSERCKDAEIVYQRLSPADFARR